MFDLNSFKQYKIVCSLYLSLFFILSSYCITTTSASLSPFFHTNSETTNSQLHKFNHQDELAIERQIDNIERNINNWATRFGREIYYASSEATCEQSIRDAYSPTRVDSANRFGSVPLPTIESIDWTTLHKDIRARIKHSMSWHKDAVESIRIAAENLAGNHSFNKDLVTEYIDVHRLDNLPDDYASVDETMPDHLSEISVDNSTNGAKDLSTKSNISTESIQLTDESAAQTYPSGDLPQALALFKDNQVQDETRQDEQQFMPRQILMPTNDDEQVERRASWKTPIKYLKLERHKNFASDALVNTEESAVHVPVHIFAADEQVMNTIAWSESLNSVFRNNHVLNHKLTNQYFASYLGMMRLFPAQKWPLPSPDLYDARMRPWYASGSSSRKDMIILVDASGSMTGSRRDIAKGVVYELLDTLTDNDHFLILKFSDKVQQVGFPTCNKLRLGKATTKIPSQNTLSTSFTNNKEIGSQEEVLNPSKGSTLKEDIIDDDIDSLTLLSASGSNIRHLKANFTISTSGIANFSRALVTAFEILQKYQNSEQLGSQCNQAIMLITDGSPSSFEDIFARYNYPNAPVRVFTYLIGREAGDVTSTKMMACQNRGYYTHVINLAEVRETVQQYIPVMARPLVLSGEHPTSWTPAYGDLTYQLLTDWIWESRQRDRARQLLQANRAASNDGGFVAEIKVEGDSGSSSTVDGISSPDYETGTYGDLTTSTYDDGIELDKVDLFGYESDAGCFWQTNKNDLLTTVVQPVYDRKNTTTLIEKFLHKNVWTLTETEVRNAQLLGVAAADLKISDIMALAPSHTLGSNGYSVLLTNNGYVMHHPHLRSILEPPASEPSARNLKVLKPFFSSLDLTEVESLDTSDIAQLNELLSLREEAVSGKVGWRDFIAKHPFECMRRVATRRQRVYFGPLGEFPFSLLVVIPQPYGSFKVDAQVEFVSGSSQLPEQLRTYFTPTEADIWTVHPDYSYCESAINSTSSVIMLTDLLSRIAENKMADVQRKPALSSKPVILPNKLVCDYSLVQSLIYDAVATFTPTQGTCGPPSPSSE